MLRKITEYRVLQEFYVPINGAEIETIRLDIDDVITVFDKLIILKIPHECPNGSETIANGYTHVDALMSKEFVELNKKIFEKIG